MKLSVLLPVVLGTLAIAAPTALNDEPASELNDNTPRSLFARDADRETCPDTRQKLVDCQQETADLNHQLDLLETQEEQCQSDKTAAQTALTDAQTKLNSTETTLANTQSQLTDANSQLTQCQDKVSAGTKGDDYLQCPAIEGTQTTVDGVTYNLRCQYGIKKGINTLRAVDLRWDACISACSADSQCQGVNWWPKNNNSCLMFSQWDANGVSKTAATTPLMAAVPVSQR